MPLTKPVISVPLPFEYATLSPLVNVLETTILSLAKTTAEPLLPSTVTDRGAVKLIAAPPDVAANLSVSVVADTTK